MDGQPCKPPSCWPSVACIMRRPGLCANSHAAVRAFKLRTSVGYVTPIRHHASKRASEHNRTRPRAIIVLLKLLIGKISVHQGGAEGRLVFSVARKPHLAAGLLRRRLELVIAAARTQKVKMNGLQAFLLGLITAWLPCFVVMAWMLRRPAQGESNAH